MNKKGVLLLATSLFLCLVALGQGRPVFSTYVYNGLQINPAYAGSLNVFSVSFTNRNQWLNVDGAPISQNLTAHNAFRENQIGVGLNVSRDAVGVHEQYNVYGAFAYKIRTRVGILAMGLQGGFDHRASDFDQLNWFDPSDNYSVSVNRYSPNFGTGLYFANRDYFIGASVPYILTPKIFDAEVKDISSEGRQSRFYYVNGGFVKDINRNVKVSPSVLIRLQDRTPASFDLNVNLIFAEVIYGGLSYRYQDSFSVMTQLVLNENFRFGYAYDIPTNELRTAGSHEFFLNYRIKLKIHKKDGLCPVYF
ncbi:PorP/SprF family type IX secretion system membrane protein [Reichenbachiella versicolor]|uniref:PorP/SprF family type IX secretion system membrane protein n=1 Tax=Reichenbachiella versicolor TaxID=1821036 RepID=UPI000D6E5C9E|nr:type IX secretion system membrane protein PorP/SprF [Reichenbachiella versicolor]